MRMQLGLQMDLRLDREMTSQDRECLQRLNDLWEQKAPFVLTFSPDDIREVFDQKVGSIPPPRIVDPRNPKGLPDTSDVPPIQSVEQEYIMLSSQEIESVQPGERVGGFVGNIMFISEEVPDEYKPIVIFNLTILQKLRGPQARSIMELCGMPEHMAEENKERHWSANLMDLAVAEKHFGAGTDEFKKFLAWRKSMERTDFFARPEFDDFLNNKLSDRRRRRTVHPLQRGRWNHLSWQMAGVVRQHGLEKIAKSLGASRVDRLCHAILGEQGFNANHMLRLIQEMKADQVTSKSVVDCRNDAVLDRQAYLLTEQIAGAAAVLSMTDQQSIYKPLRSALLTLAAFEDRIAFFASKTLESAGFTPQLLSALRRSTPIVIETLNIDLNRDSAAVIDQEIQNAYGKIREIEEMMERIQELKDQMSEMTTSAGVTVVPASLEEEDKALFTMRETLEKRIDELERARALMDKFTAFRSDLGLVIASIPQPLPVDGEDAGA